MDDKIKDRTGSRKMRRLVDEETGRIRYIIIHLPGHLPPNVVKSSCFGNTCITSAWLNEQELSQVDAISIEKDSLVHAAVERWHVDRMDSPFMNYDGILNITHNGTGVEVFVLDSGVRETHADFQGRASYINDLTDEADYFQGSHGTHVSGIVTGAQSGLARGVDLKHVRVLGSDGTGIVSDIIEAIYHCNEVKTTAHPIISMSLGGLVGAGPPTVLEQTIANFPDIIFIAAAGNENTNACFNSPSRSEHVIAVGALGIADNRASFSNYGACVDFYAPGVNILSTSPESDNTYTYMSGTSMATPLVAAVAASYQDAANGTLNAADMRATLRENSVLLGGLYRFTFISDGDIMSSSVPLSEIHILAILLMLIVLKLTC